MPDLQLNIMVLTDNQYIYDSFTKIVEEKNLGISHHFKYACSTSNPAFDSNNNVTKLNISDTIDTLIENFNLIISCHSRQIFPAKLVNSVRCINIHPGLNPYNRGWYPQIFSIMNKMPLGATIHEMDELIDHGDIIAQKEIELCSWDTSLTAYNKVIQAEVELMNDFIEDIIDGAYHATPMHSEGNYNSKADFNKLCKLDLDETLTVKEVIDMLRALTHGDYKNAYFIDDKNNKVYVNIELERAS
jgi:methionyl-tRNA formyltransferase